MHAAHHRLEIRRLKRSGGPETLAELLASPGVVEQCELRGPFGLMAIHGGGLEMMTDVIASQAAELAGASYYGVIHPDDVEHHLPSSRFWPDDSPVLRGFLAHVDAVVSIHGYGREGSWTSLLVGGRNRDLAEAVADHLREHVDGYDVVTDLDRIPPELRGLSERNPVNLPRRGGVQIELPPRVRGLSPLSPPPGEDGLPPPTRAVIEALAAVARRWPER